VPTIYDISVPVAPGLPTWPGDPPLVLERYLKMEDGSDANATRFAASVHIGTHIDAPRHFLADGATVDQVPLEQLIGPAWVVDLTHVEAITAQALAQAHIPAEAQRLIFKTRNATLWQKPGFQKDYVAITPDGAQWLVERGVRLVGVDYLSVAPFDDPVPTHRILLGAGMVLIEGLYLPEVPPGRYTLYCLPLRLQGAEGAPARAILIKEP
jgi:Predicted metal-dependent hydrolase